MFRVVDHCRRFPPSVVTGHGIVWYPKVKSGDMIQDACAELKEPDYV